MSKIEELLKNEKVEWKKLEEVLKYEQPLRYIVNSTEYKDTYCIPVLTAGQTFILGYTNEKENVYQASKENPVIIFDDFTASNHWVDFDFKVKSSAMKMIKPKDGVNLRYCYHYMQIMKVDTTEHKRLWISKFSQMEIPIPSPETQKKIVEILDNFTDYVTELQAELQAELQNRIKQYEYYRNMLLSEEYLNKLSDKLGILPMEAENQIRCTTLGEIGKICMCKRILKEQTLPKGDVPFYKIGTFGKKADAFISREVFDEYKEKYSYPKEGEVLISCSGTIGRTVIFDGKDAYFQDSNIIWLSHDESIVLNKYLFYFYQNARWNATSGGTISRLYTYNLVNLNIELPSLPLQNKIVEILDKFQSMLFDTKGLLPKEIEQRRKQYEYYREKLLTFDMESDSKQASKQASKIIARSYFIILKHAAETAGIELLTVDWKTLGNIGEFENGIGMPKSLFSEGEEIGAIHYGHIYTRYNLFVDKPIVSVSKKDAEKLKKLRYGDLVIAKTSENVEDVMKTVAYLGYTEAVTGGHSAIFHHHENPKYLSYVLNGANYAIKQKNRLARGVKVIELSTADMEKISIPLPPRSVQDKIVSILDDFNTLINDISNGLPKEVELRQKQYEHYRGKLLNFRKEE